MNFIKKFIDITTIKFLIVGVINTLVGTSIMFFLYNILHTGYWIASAANYVVGSIVSYFLNKHFTFQNREKSFRMILRFVLNISVCYLLAYGLAKPLVYYVLVGVSKQIRENIAMVVGMCLFVGFNYIGQRFVVFTKNVDSHT